MLTGRRLPVVDNHVLHDAMVETLRAWNQHTAIAGRTAETAKFSPEWTIHVEHVVHSQTTETPTGEATTQVESIRLLHHTCGVWAVWQGSENELVTSSQSLLIVNEDLADLCARVSKIAADDPEPDGFFDGGLWVDWLLVEDMLGRYLSSPAPDASEGDDGFDPTTDPPEFLRRMTSEPTYLIMKAEFETFTSTLSRKKVSSVRGRSRSKDRVTEFPLPSSWGGLPFGWQVRWHSHVSGSRPADDFDTFVVQRTGGGWALVIHSLDYNEVPLTSMWETASMSVEGLYRTAETQALLFPGSADGPERVIGEFVASQYNLGDPVEAAEATLVGLGGRMQVFPRALI